MVPGLRGVVPFYFFTFPWSDLTRGRRANRDDLRRFVLAKPILDFSSSRPAGVAMATIREAAARLDFDHRAVNIRITGSEAFEHESVDSGLADVPKLLAGALVLVSLVLFCNSSPMTPRCTARKPACEQALTTC